MIQEYAIWSTKSLKLGLSVVMGLIITASLSIFLFLPPLDYLPDGNRNFVFARIIVPPGYNKEATIEVLVPWKKQQSHYGKQKVMNLMVNQD